MKTAPAIQSCLMDASNVDDLHMTWLAPNCAKSETMPFAHFTEKLCKICMLFVAAPQTCTLYATIEVCLISRYNKRKQKQSLT